MYVFKYVEITVSSLRCCPALSVRSLAQKIAHVYIFYCGMHTASDSMRRSRYTTLWFKTCANILLFAHRTRGLKCACHILITSVLNFTLRTSRSLLSDKASVCMSWKCPLHTESVVLLRANCDALVVQRAIYKHMF